MNGPMPEVRSREMKWNIFDDILNVVFMLPFFSSSLDFGPRVAARGRLWTLDFYYAD